MSDETWPEWATVTDIGGGRFRLDLDGTLNGTVVKGHAVGSLEGMRKLIATLIEFEAAHESVAALLARAGLPGDAPISSVPRVTWHTTKPLERAGLRTLGAVASFTDEQLLALHGFGERRLAALKDALREVRSAA
ncbi:hypothetical protein ACU635_50960 [[Actinomadura] parvosata]|uniref:hypothetical protein n=1 Tax=[Actinomadura] parvosata TaxID=1955412 RepID=UPI00406D3D9F